MTWDCHCLIVSLAEWSECEHIIRIQNTWIWFWSTVWKYTLKHTVHSWLSHVMYLRVYLLSLTDVSLHTYDSIIQLQYRTESVESNLTCSWTKKMKLSQRIKLRTTLPAKCVWRFAAPWTQKNRIAVPQQIRSRLPVPEKTVQVLSRNLLAEPETGMNWLTDWLIFQKNECNLMN